MGCNNPTTAKGLQLRSTQVEETQTMTFLKEIKINKINLMATLKKEQPQIQPLFGFCIGQKNG